MKKHCPHTIKKQIAINLLGPELIAQNDVEINGSQKTNDTVDVKIFQLARFHWLNLRGWAKFLGENHQCNRNVNLTNQKKFLYNLGFILTIVIFVIVSQSYTTSEKGYKWKLM